MALLLFLGCRPKEAAWILFNKSISRNDIRVTHQSHKWKATMPKEHTKTKVDYVWLVPAVLNDLVQAMITHDGTGYDDYEKLKDSLRKFFADTVLPEAGVRRQAAPKKLYNLRSIRAFRATEWVKLDMEYKMMEWRDPPRNPLQHLNVKTTLKKYAELGSNDENSAKKRCITKYYGDESKRQPWMEDWVAEFPHLNPQRSSARIAGRAGSTR